jgi:hypothetical protein
MHDTSTFGTVRKMIELYGIEAHSEARRRSQRALERDDLRGFERWTSIAGMIGGISSRAALPPIHLSH